MANQIAKYTQLGIPFETVLDCCTRRPAEHMGLAGEAGCAALARPACFSAARGTGRGGLSST